MSVGSASMAAHSTCGARMMFRTRSMRFIRTALCALCSGGATVDDGSPSVIWPQTDNDSESKAARLSIASSRLQHQEPEACAALDLGGEPRPPCHAPGTRDHHAALKV